MALWAALVMLSVHDIRTLDPGLDRLPRVLKFVLRSAKDEPASVEERLVEALGPLEVGLLPEQKPVMVRPGLELDGDVNLDPLLGVFA